MCWVTSWGLPSSVVQPHLLSWAMRSCSSGNRGMFLQGLLLLWRMSGSVLREASWSAEQNLSIQATGRLSTASFSCDGRHLLLMFEQHWLHIASEDWLLGFSIETIRAEQSLSSLSLPWMGIVLPKSDGPDQGYVALIWDGEGRVMTASLNGSTGNCKGAERAAELGKLWKSKSMQGHSELLRNFLICTYGVRQYSTPDLCVSLTAFDTWNSCFGWRLAGQIEPEPVQVMPELPWPPSLQKHLSESQTAVDQKALKGSLQPRGGNTHPGAELGSNTLGLPCDVCSSNQCLIIQVCF